MLIKYTEDDTGVDWAEVATLLAQLGMASYPPEKHRQAFRNSQHVCFAWMAGKLAGFGRTISDGAYQAAIYDLAVRPEYQGQGIGHGIMEHLMASLQHCHVILYTTRKNEAFYAEFGFHRLEFGMGRFLDDH